METIKCPSCDGTGKQPMMITAIALPPKEQREYEQSAADHPVKCWRCDGTGKLIDHS